VRTGAYLYWIEQNYAERLARWRWPDPLDLSISSTIRTKDMISVGQWNRPAKATLTHSALVRPWPGWRATQKLLTRKVPGSRRALGS